MHGDPEAVAGLAQHVLGRDPNVLEVQVAQVVAAQAHRLVAVPDLEPLHALLDDEGRVAVLAVHLGAGEGDEHGSLVAVADEPLLAVQLPGAVGLQGRPRLQVERVRARLGLGEREGRELAPGGEVGEEALLLLVASEQHDSLHADRLMHAHHDRQGRVDLREGLEHPAVAGLGEALPAVALGHVQAAQAALAELADQVVADPPVLLDPARVDRLGGELSQRGDQGADPVLLTLGGLRVGKDELVVDLAEEQRLGE